MKYLLIISLMTLLACKKDPSSESVDPVKGETLPSTSTPDRDPPSPETPTVNKSWTDEFMELINSHRTSMGLRVLILSEGMTDIATQHSQNMATGKVAFGHTGFSDRCTDSRTVLGGGNWCGENVAAGQTSPQSAFNSWMNSFGHRANIESTRATHTGFGYAKSSSGKYYWTQIFLEH